MELGVDVLRGGVEVDKGVRVGIEDDDAVLLLYLGHAAEYVEAVHAEVGHEVVCIGDGGFLLGGGVERLGDKMSDRLLYLFYLLRVLRGNGGRGSFALLHLFRLSELAGERQLLEFGQIVPELLAHDLHAAGDGEIG